MARAGRDQWIWNVEFGVETAVMRETLHKLKSKVWLWFVPKKNGRGWEIDRGRFKAEVDRQVYYDGGFDRGEVPGDVEQADAASRGSRAG